MGNNQVPSNESLLQGMLLPSNRKWDARKVMQNYLARSSLTILELLGIMLLKMWREQLSMMMSLSSLTLRKVTTTPSTNRSNTRKMTWNI